MGGRGARWLRLALEHGARALRDGLRDIMRRARAVEFHSRRRSASACRLWDQKRVICEIEGENIGIRERDPLKRRTLPYVGVSPVTISLLVGRSVRGCLVVRRCQFRVR